MEPKNQAKTPTENPAFAAQAIAAHPANFQFALFWQKPLPAVNPFRFDKP
jgi:hypothetical protein